MKFKVGDRVKKSDAEASSVEAYRDLIGTVDGFDWTYILVKWDVDGNATPSRYQPKELVKVNQ